MDLEFKVIGGGRWQPTSMSSRMSGSRGVQLRATLGMVVAAHRFIKRRSHYQLTPLSPAVAPLQLAVVIDITRNKGEVGGRR